MDVKKGREGFLAEGAGKSDCYSDQQRTILSISQKDGESEIFRAKALTREREPTLWLKGPTALVAIQRVKEGVPLVGEKRSMPITRKRPLAREKR